MSFEKQITIGCKEVKEEEVDEEVVVAVDEVLVKNIAKDETKFNEFVDKKIDNCVDSSSTTSSGTSVCGYDADCDNEDNETICYEDNQTIEQLTTEQLPKHLDSYSCSGFVDTNNNLNNNCFGDKKWIFIGSTVLSRWTDGLHYMGLIVQVCPLVHSVFNIFL